MKAGASSDLNSLDLSVLDQLAELKEQRETLQARLKQMDERRSEVLPAVYLRVRSDYEQQRIKLAALEAPLKNDAREVYSQLRERLDSLARETDEAQISLQELEFRHSLGEFDKPQYNARRGAIEAGMGERAGDSGKAKEIRERFLSVFEHEADLEADVAPPQPVAIAVAPPIPEPAPLASSYTPIPQASMAPQVPGMPPIPGSAPPPPREPEPRRPANPDATVVFRPGRLTPMNPEAGIAPTMLSLKPISIGSDNSCDVRIAAPGVAKRQVDITLSRAGFILKDVGGGGGVLVDGQAVTEQILRDGDSIQIGPARFSFKLA
jgi:hypothetical protein